jgi:hypothetical protein
MKGGQNNWENRIDKLHVLLKYIVRVLNIQS